MADKTITPFAKKVYKVVLGIPLGEVRTYKWVAQRIKRPKSSRAVGQALKSNPYPLLIPCHRVVATGNRLGGYSGGIRKKKILLDLEKRIKGSII